MFELSPNDRGGWTHTVLHSFGAGTDGAFPRQSDLGWRRQSLRHHTGGGTYNVGTVFELSPSGSGGWVETLLYSFNDNGSDGTYPYAGLVFDSAGNLYGTTYSGGVYNYGSVFELSPHGGGGWTETVLHSFDFQSRDGINPEAGLILDASGNLYGTTSYWGSSSYGTAFELSPNGRGGWTETELHGFGGAQDGFVPRAGLTMDHAGNLYGTTVTGGSGEQLVGTVFEITR